VGFLLTKRVRYIEGIHTITRNLSLLEPLGITEVKPELKIWLTKEDRVFSESFLHEHNVSDNELLIGFHPGSLLIKRWPSDNFASLGNILMKDYGAKILVVGGPDEFNLAEEISKFMEQKPMIASGYCTIRQTAALIEACDLFISNDSGLMHIATAVETPVIALFGSSGYQKFRFGPYGDRNVTMTKNLPCSYPCFPRLLNQECKTKECLEMITVREVLEKIEEKLAQKNKAAKSKFS